MSTNKPNLNESDLKYLSDINNFKRIKHIERNIEYMLEEIYQRISQEFILPPQVGQISLIEKAKVPKISKGNNYNDAPWLVLDFPRHFEKEHILAIRLICLFGQYIGLTLHLKGDFMNHLSAKVHKKADHLQESNFMLDKSQNEWQHSIDDLNYYPISATKLKCENLLEKNTLQYFKISKKYQFEHLIDLIPKITSDYKLLLEIISQ